LWEFHGRSKNRWSLGEENDAFETGKVKPPDLPRSGRPVTAVSPEILQRDAIVREDGRSITQQLALSLLTLKKTLIT
jgi:hypothetical protein